MSDQKERPKIIVDEDWKTQVESERERLKTPVDKPAAVAPDADGALPVASFELLVSSLVTQTLVDLGQFPNPLDNKYSVQLDLAQHNIDMLGMIELKTKGNLTSDEAQMLEDVLHQLRMAFVSVSNHVQKNS